MTPQQQYISVPRRALDVEDYIDILRRHTSWVLGPLFAGLVISCVIAFFLRNTYISTAELRVTPPQISEALVPSTVTQQMDERLAQMQTQILSQTSLGELIQRPALNLYPSERASLPLYDVVERMRERDIHVVRRTSAGGGTRAATSFTISFSYQDRYKAQAVVQALITRFTEEAFNLQTGQGKVTSEFLKDEITQAKADLTRLDNELVAFRMQNQGHLPEDLAYNAQNLNAVNQRLSAANEAINRISEEKLFLVTNLQTYKNQRDELQQLSNTTVEMGGTMHRNERLALLKSEITNLEAGLNQSLQFQTESHPNIRSLKSLIEVKKQERDKLQAQEDGEAAKTKVTKKVVSDPVIRGRLIENQGRIDETNAALQAKENERLEKLKQVDELSKQIKMYQERISSSPPNQQRYASMLREYSMAEATYQEFHRKEAAASTYDDVGKRKAGENLEVLDNASLPETPALPNRWLICGIGVGSGLMIGILLTAFKEINNTSLKNLKDVRAYTQLPILSSIPLLENDLLVRRKRRLAYVGWSAAIVIGVVAMSSSMYYHYFLNS